MQNRTATPKNEKPTTELFVDAVLERQSCKKHGAAIGEPCGTMGPYRAICNARAKRAGFNAPIRPESLRLHRQSKKK